MLFIDWRMQVQKEYRKRIYRTTWLPEALRLKYGKVTGTVAATSAPNQSSSTSAGKLNVSNTLIILCLYSPINVA